MNGTEWKGLTVWLPMGCVWLAPSPTGGHGDPMATRHGFCGLSYGGHGGPVVARVNGDHGDPMATRVDGGHGAPWRPVYTGVTGSCGQ